MCSMCYMCLALRGRDGHHGNEKVPSAHTEQWQIATNKQSWKKCLIIITTGISYTEHVCSCVRDVPCWCVFMFHLICSGMNALYDQ